MEVRGITFWPCPSLVTRRSGPPHGQSRGGHQSQIFYTWFFFLIYHDWCQCSGFDTTKAGKRLATMVHVRSSSKQLKIRFVPMMNDGSPT